MRVFVSSTFRDMQAEREELIKHIFPKLRKLCESRGVVWGEVDLRWGITDEQTSEGRVLPICLAEIQRCRPYFIGILGERYGWIPQEISKELMSTETWLKAYQGLSVTELEVLHGVLNDPNMAGHAFFYFRDPEYINRLPKGFNKKDFISEEEASKKKLLNLKEKIRKSGLPVRENYPDPEKMGDLVFNDLEKVINNLFPEGSQPDPLSREILEHEIFARIRAKVYIGRKEYFESLDQHAKKNDLPIVVQGESGSGKSALLANWALNYKKEYPKDLVIMHFIGASASSIDWASMLRRIMAEFKRHFDIKQDIPDKNEELRSTFPNWLSMAAAKGRIILILDSLNQLEDRDGALDLIWLPSVIPENVRLILSALPGRPLEELGKRGWQKLNIKPLDNDEKMSFINEYLSLYTKSINEERAERIIASSQSSNPLFLQSLLEELRIFGVYEKLDERIAFYLKARDIPELYEKILSRYEEDYEKEYHGLIKDSMSLIWAARRGLSEVELLDLLGKKGNPLPNAIWSPLYLAAESSLINRGGLLNFSHDYFTQAIEKRYLSGEKIKQKYHLKLAEYFQAQESGLRKTEELPWHFYITQTWKKLFKLLTDLDFFQQVWETNQYDAKLYWANIVSNSQFNMIAGYNKIIKSPEKYQHDYIGILRNLFHYTGHLEEASLLNEYLTKYYRKIGHGDNLLASLGNQGIILKTKGDLDGAMKLYKEQEQICRELGFKPGLQTSLINQANILYIRSDHEGAIKLYEESEQICRELGNKDTLQASLGNQANILYFRGDHDGAMKLYKEQESICLELGNQDGLSISLGGQAIVFYSSGNVNEAMILHKEQELICRELGNKYELSNSLLGQGVIQKSRGDIDGAMKLYQESEQICREMGIKHVLRVALGNQAEICSESGDLDGAMVLYKEQEHICREMGNQNKLQACLGNQGVILYEQGNLDGAMKLYKEQEHIYRELDDRRGLQASLGEQGVILHNRGDLDGAMKLYKEQEHICRELGNKHGLQASIGNQATIHKTQGDLDEAMRLYKEQEHICREMGSPDSIALALINQSLCLNMIGQNQDALLLAEEALDLASKYGFTALSRQIKPIYDQLKSI